MTALHRAARFLGLIPSRHPVGSLTGWACLSRIRPAVFDDFTRPRATSPRINPYPSKETS